jgi:ATP-GRASP peptide maturase of grasp-with-spasm system
MVLILSIAKDNSTTLVIEWLDHLKVDWVRINKEDEVSINYIKGDLVLNVHNKKIKLSEVTSYWYRRGFVSFNHFTPKKDDYSHDVFPLIEKESSYLRNYFYYLLNKKRHLNSYHNSDVNKLIVSDIAENLGILTPRSYILDSKKELQKVEESVITKTISGSPLLINNNKAGMLYTSEVDDIHSASEEYYPSLFQEKIEKKYELRIFFMDDQFYSMAIFSQKDNKTAVDFRKYNRKTPNRNVPYNLPNAIKIKLSTLMKKIGLNCGSIDMIVTPTDKYYFLEVNPVGQFGMVSFPCNYNLERKIAKYLKGN